MVKSEPYRQVWMTDDQYECACLFADVLGGFHHLPGKIKPWGDGIQLNVLGSWASYDFNQLTRIIVLGHDRMIRVEVGPSGPRLFRVCLHKRHTREGSMAKKIPTIEDAIKEIRGRLNEVV